MKGKLYLAPDGEIISGIVVNFEADKDAVYSVECYRFGSYTFYSGYAINKFVEIPTSILPLLRALWK